MDTVYEFRDDEARVRAMQDASRSPRTDAGLSPAPLLVGSDEWWDAIADGRIQRHEMTGIIGRVYWASMGDWPEFELVDDHGNRQSWTREGDVSRYVEGARASVVWVEHPWKETVARQMLSSHSRIVLEIQVEDTGERSDPRAPGPGAIGLA